MPMMHTHRNAHDNAPSGLRKVSDADTGLEAVIMGLSRYTGYGALLIVLGFLTWVLVF